MPSANFTASTARIAALSDRLLSMSDVERMLSAPNATESGRVLNDLSWAGTLASASDPADFESIIDAGLYEIKTMLVHASPSFQLLELLLLPFDLQNAKTSLAAHFRDVKYEEIRESLSSLSLYPRRTAYEILEGKPVKRFSAYFFETAVREAAEYLQKNKDKIGDAEEILDLAFFEHIAKSVSLLGSRQVSEFFKMLVEAENIKKVVRRSEGEYYLSAAKGIPGIRSRVSREEMIKKLHTSSLKPYLDEGLDLASTKGDLFGWEVRLDMSIVESLFWKARANPTGPENIILFFLTKLRNAEVIRMILVGKKNRFSNQKIREMIAPFLSFLPKK